MQTIRHFNLVFYTMLVIGFAGFAISAESGGVFLFATSIVILRAMIGRERVRVLPNLISWLSLMAVLLCGVLVARGQISAVLGFSYLLVCLILAKLFDQRGNRDYAQVMVMSLLLMTAAAINSASLVYGLLFIIHLLMGLYLSLLLHLKSEAESASGWMRPSPGGARPAAETAELHRSLRRLSITITCVAVIAGVAAFLFIPRTRVMGTVPSPQQRTSPMTGFSERVSFEQVARISQNQDVVAHVKLLRAGTPYNPGDFYLRGTTLNLYTGATPVDREGGRWQWFRRPLSSTSDRSFGVGAGEVVRLTEEEPPADAIQIDVDLEPTGTRVLFFLPGASRVWSQRGVTLEYHPVDGSLKISEPMRGPLRYSAICTMNLGPAVEATPQEESSDRPRRFRYFRRWLPATSRIDPQIESYARRPEVSGQTPEGAALADARGASAEPTEFDEAIARSIEAHLRKEFAYTLDLTDTTRSEDTDPLVAFLYDYRRGHCEYFAGAMTLMCQSLGLQARMVIGFHVGGESFNSVGEYYVVRQSNAHAWVEVLTPSGWLQFDPTSGSAGSVRHRPNPSLASRARDIWDYLQYRWAVGVVTYSEENRVTLIERVSAGAQQGSNWFNDQLATLNRWIREEAAYRYSFNIIGATIAVFILLAMAAVIAYFYERYRLRRRAERLGLDSATLAEQLRLAKQLAFYDMLLRLLERHQIRRAPHQTPREFARSLTHLPAGSYKQVRDITEIFYRIRFGGRDLTPARQRWLSGALRSLSRRLEELPVQSPGV